MRFCFKRMLSCLLALVMIFSCVNCAVVAADEYSFSVTVGTPVDADEDREPNDDAIIDMGEGKDNKTNVTFALKNDDEAGFATYQLNVRYDTNVFKFVVVGKNTEATSPFGKASVKHKEGYSSIVAINLDGEDVTDEYVLEFALELIDPENTYNGTYEISITDAKFSNAAEELLPVKMNETVQQITVKGCKPSVDMASDEISIEVADHDLTYTAGAQNAPAVTVKHGEKTLVEGTDYVLEGALTATAAGEHTINVKAAASNRAYTGTGTAKWNIKKADIGGVDATKAISVYNVEGNSTALPAFTPVLKGSDAGTETTYTIKSGAEYIEITEDNKVVSKRVADSNGKTATIEAVVKATGDIAANYNEAKCTITVTVKDKNDVSEAVTMAAKDGHGVTDYESLGSGKTAAAFAEDAVVDSTKFETAANPSITYQLKQNGAVIDSGAALADLAIENAGSYEIVAVYSDDLNEGASDPITVTVAKTVIGLTGWTWNTSAVTAYTGNDQTVTLVGSDERIVVTPAGNVQKNAGTYTATATVALAEGYSADNYEISGSIAPQEWTIDRAVVTDAIPVGMGLPYNGNEITFYTKPEEVTQFTVVSGDKATAVGDYKLVLKLDDNYKWSDDTTADKEIVWGIAEGNPATHVPASTKVLYNKQQHTFTNKQLADAVAKVQKAPGAITVVSVSVATDETNLIEACSVVDNAINFTIAEIPEYNETVAARKANLLVTYKAANYLESSAIVEISLMNKTPLEDSVLTVKDNQKVTYDGTEYSAANLDLVTTTAEADTEDGKWIETYSFTRTDAAGAVDADKISDAGVYEVAVTIEDGDEIAEKTLTFTIEAAELDAPTVSVSKEYDGNDVIEDNDITVTFENESVTYTKATESKYSDKNVGADKGEIVVAVTLTGTYANNYNITGTEGDVAEVKATGKITEKEITVAVAVAEADYPTYTGEVQTPKFTVEATGLVASETLSAETDYEVDASNAADRIDVADESKIIIKSKAGSNYKITACTGGEFDIKAAALTKDNVSGSIVKEYDGAAIDADDVKAALTVKFGDETVAGTWTVNTTDVKNPAEAATINLTFAPTSTNFTGFTADFAAKITKAEVTSEEVTAAVDKSVTVKEYIDKLIEEDLTIGEEVMIERETVVVKIDGKEVPAADWEKTKIPANAKVTVTAESSDDTKFEDLDITVTPYEANVTPEIFTNITLTAGSKAHGTVTWRPIDADEGDTVTVTVRPDKGYAVKDVTVIASNGKAVKVFSTGANKFSFVMPAGKAKIDVEYKKAETVKFNDVDTDDWFYDAVMYAVENGLFNGVSDTEFAPNATMTRGMLVTVLHRMEGAPKARASQFKDVKDGAWYEEAVAWAASEGIVTGMTETTFAPNAAITREQMATILYRYAQYKGMSTRGYADLDDYTDASSVSAYAEKAMNWAVAKGLITGLTETTLAPTGTATRAQVATILMRFLG